MINKERILDDSLVFIEFCDLLWEIKINFENEEVKDAGGLIREWVLLINKEIFKRENNAFEINEEGFYNIKEVSKDMLEK